MGDDPKRVLFAEFNPYEARHPGRAVVSREAILLAKRLRLDGFDVVLGSGSGGAGYTIRKGFSDLITDPVVIKVFGVAASVVIGLVTSWLYDLLKRRGDEEKIPDELSIVIDVDDHGNRVRYDHKGREISDHRFGRLIDEMKKRQEDYAATLAVVSPEPDLPHPIYVEHTTRIVGWANVKYVEGRGLMVHPSKITDAATKEKMSNGDLPGFSIAGIVMESICQTCNSTYRDCNHGADAGDDCINEIKKIDLCEISIVAKPVNQRCDWNLKDVDNRQDNAGGD